MKEPRGKQGRLTVVVMGTGSVGMRHLEVLRQLNDVDVIALPSRPERRAELLQAGFVVARDLSSIAGYTPTHCIVATDTCRHGTDGQAAVTACLSLLVEKPLALDAKEGAALASLARQTSRPLTVGCVLRCSESLNRFRHELPRIGHLHSVVIECRSYLPDWRPERAYRESYSARRREGGVLLDLIHEIDYATWLFGWPKSLTARVENLGRLGIETEEMAFLYWKAPQGYPVSLHLDYLTRPPQRTMRAYGEQGMLEWDGIEGLVRLSRPGEKEEVIHSLQTRDDMFRRQAEAFLYKGATGLASGDEGVRALAICDAARRASETRREEVIEYL